MMEAGVLIDLQGNPIHWHLPPGRSVGYLPDSEDLWQVIWKNKDNISGFAHSHPGGGDPGPSWTDITTFSGIELALGRRLKWWIISSDSIALVEWANKDKYTYTVNKCDDNFVWLKKLHDVSYNETRRKFVTMANEIGDLPTGMLATNLDGLDDVVIGGPQRLSNKVVFK